MRGEKQNKNSSTAKALSLYGSPGSRENIHVCVKTRVKEAKDIVDLPLPLSSLHPLLWVRPLSALQPLCQLQAPTLAYLKRDT